MRAKGYVARGLRVRLKTTRFEMLTRQRRLRRPTDAASEFLAVARSLLDEFDHPGPYRLVGLAAFDLAWRSEPLQMDIFEDGTRRNLELAIDSLVQRYGSGVVLRARDLGRHGTVMANGVNLDYLDERDGEPSTVPA